MSFTKPFLHIPKPEPGTSSRGPLLVPKPEPGMGYGGTLLEPKQEQEPPLLVEYRGQWLASPATLQTCWGSSRRCAN